MHDGSDGMPVMICTADRYSTRRSNAEIARDLLDWAEASPKIEGLVREAAAALLASSSDIPESI